MAALSETIGRVHSGRGRRWLAELPALLDECRARWAVELGAPFENLSYNLVLPGRLGGGAEVVLKAGVPCRELLTEAAALRLFAGCGAVRLLDADEPRGILLLERVTPGAPLHESQSEPEAARTAGGLMRRLWREPPDEHPFPPLAVWFGAYGRLRDRFGGGTGPFREELIERAEKTFAELTATSDRSVVLHGDLHHYNILSSSGGGWLAIDPKGVEGDPGYEVGPFMLNRLPEAASEATVIEILGRRLTVFSEELGIGRRRLARWAFCHAVLSALWDFEEGAAWQRTIRLAEVIERLGG